MTWVFFILFNYVPWGFLHTQKKTNKYVENVLFSTLIKRPVLMGVSFKGCQESASVMIG